MNIRPIKTEADYQTALQRIDALLGYGGVCLLLVGLNNYVYYTHRWLVWLPILQKVSFVVVLGWFVAVNWLVYRRGILAKNATL